MALAGRVRYRLEGGEPSGPTLIRGGPTTGVRSPKTTPKGLRDPRGSPSSTMSSGGRSQRGRGGNVRASAPAEGGRDASRSTRAVRAAAVPIIGQHPLPIDRRGPETPLRARRPSSRCDSGSEFPAKVPSDCVVLSHPGSSYVDPGPQGGRRASWRRVGGKYEWLTLLLPEVKGREKIT